MPGCDHLARSIFPTGSKLPEPAVELPIVPAVHVADPYFWGSYPMAPWCNRVAPGRMQVAGRELDLPATFPDGTAIHGQVCQAAWALIGDGAWRIEAGGGGWPWRYAVEQWIAASDRRFDLELSLTNLSDAPMPAGIFAALGQWRLR